MQQESFESLYPPTTRFAEIEKMVAYLREGRSCQLIGIPGTGRSTLLTILANNRHVRMKHFGAKHKDVHFVIANFSEVRNRSPFDVMKFLFLNLTESLRERKMLEENKAVGDIFREHLQFHDELVLFQGFKEAIDYLALERKIQIVFLFDRFEEYIPTVTSDFFTSLRTLRNRAKYHFSVVFSVYRSLETFLEPSVLADYYDFVAGNIVYLPLFDKESTDFRVSYIEKVTRKTIDKKVLQDIIALTGGCGRLIKLSAEAVLAHGGEKKLDTFLLSQKTIQGALNEIWLTLSPAEQAALQTGMFGDSEIVDYLVNVGLVRDNLMQIPLFAAFIGSLESHKESSSSEIVYDEHTNTIKKGTSVLSDQLTASEFRLLRYLLQNKDRIIDREELITVVWAENKSTAGITDQAVDQLIFRLRKKIEADTNNPHHLQTVKGRGFKFV